ncbi:NAD(P)H-hydrate dehydratase [Bdellovibrio reynosensis]|uniref:ADP-dependent (S)-NAD(P)H-hydrate dehydratase n=1 Tax=Bdellovibrio reynosensis TaxID=2835041 RepID=A0ABY4C8L7_9BACT|nr:NAD(P)H-hydrate dehydratase [Bdellovibrio reynosensis]UOE99832.1 NAD(P)H-hydrate dehydratase [Bdellovibrio reynosensis]
MTKSTAPVLILKKAAARKLLPVISEQDHKGSRGRSLILAGSAQFPGAAVLAAKAALRMGSGYVCVAQKNVSISSLENPDFLVADLNKTPWQEIQFNSVLVGPGFGINDFTASVIQQLKQAQVENVVLDADALRVCADEKLFPVPDQWILTPHAAEMGYCLGINSSDVNSDREASIREGHALMGGVVLLKGHRTLIFSGKDVYTNATGNSALAKSGTGDVLAGIITALRAQGLSALKAALLGAYVHGATANLWKAHKKDLISMTASDVIDYLPEVLFRIRNS